MQSDRYRITAPTAQSDRPTRTTRSLQAAAHRARQIVSLWDVAEIQRRETDGAWTVVERVTRPAGRKKHV